MPEAKPKLQSGAAFRLQPDGQWKPEKLPPEVLKEAEFSGYLTIQGYRCTVFETPSKEQWAQKSTGTSGTASRRAAGNVPDLPKIQEDQYEIWDDGYGNYYLFFRSQGKMWFVVSDDPDSFNPADAEENDESPFEGAWAQGWKFVKSGTMSGGSIASRIATRWLQAAKKYLVFNMPSDQDWPADLWERLGVGGDWERLGRAFYNAGVDVDDTEDVTLEFDEKDEPEVRKIIETARSGGFGPDVQAYWQAAQENADAGSELNQDDQGQQQQASLASRLAARWLRAEEAAPKFSPSPDPLDPQKYLIRVGRDAYVLVPFTENVIEDLAKLTSSAVMTGHQVLDALHGALGGVDVSVWMDGDGDNVEWMHGNDVDEKLLKSMGTYDGQIHKSVASRIATRWLRAQQDVLTQVQKKLDRGGEDKDYDKAIIQFVEQTRNKLPPIDKALEKAAELLLKTKDKVEHKHPKVQDHYVQKFIQELAQKHRELQDMRNQLMRGLTVELDRYEAEANVVE